LSEVTGNRRVFSVVDPLRGREQDLTEADPPPDDSRWSISPDGNSIAFVPLYGGNNGNQIQIINTFDRSTHSIVLRDLHRKVSHLQLQSVSWAPDNKHLYASAWTGSSFTISHVSLDGDVAVLLEMPDMQK
jgi:Tol biopolymer transport system component